MSKRTTPPAPLSRKLLWLGAFPSVVMFIVLMVFFTSARLEDARTTLFNSSQALADNLAPAVEYAVVSGNRRGLEQILEQSLRRSEAEWIRVADVLNEEVGYVARDGMRPESAGKAEVFEAEILQQPLDMGSNSQSDWFEPDYSFGTGALRVGTVEVGVSMAYLAAKRRDILWTSLAVGFALLAFTLIIVNQLLHGIVSPIKELSQRVSDLINAQYDQRPVNRYRTTQEVAELEEKLNALAHHLAQLKESRDQTLSTSEHARERAESANLAKSEFLAVMSHELRTPLNGVLGMIELISEEPLTARQRDYLQTARQSTEDLLTVINDILDFSRIDRGKLQLENQEFDARQVIENCAATYRHLAESRGLVLSLQFLGYWPNVPKIIGDGSRLRQILAGLLDNAIKFTDEGSVCIQAEWFSLENDCMILNCSVRDSGAGIPTDRMNEIFNTFEQLDSSHSRRYGGTGMGLSLVQRLVELMGGHITVETDLGTGSCFRFELPFELAAQGAAAPAPAEQFRESINASGISRALVVEDNVVNQRVATALLTRLGFETDAVSNGKEALDRVRASHSGYSVILMDCQMPVMDGYEATRSIREWERSNGQIGTPIIALTADALPGTEQTCREAGMNDYLAKPVRKESLQAILSRWIQF